MRGFLRQHDLGRARVVGMVAVPMTIAAVVAAKDTHHSPDLVFAAGLLLVVWIGVELAFIKAYS